MAILIVTTEDQIQRLNAVLHKVEELQKLDFETLKTRPAPKSWSVMEVLKHLDIAYAMYRPKFDEVLEKAEPLQKDPKAFQVRRWQKIIINMQRPKNGSRRWKMKTLSRFEPIFQNESLDERDLEKVFEDFFESHRHFKDCILRSRTRAVGNYKIISGIGPIVKFYLPEAFEFLLCHLERHLVQIDSILKTHRVKETA